MKKYEKVNLTSDIYRNKSRSRSPINIKLSQATQQQSARKNYHNVCCPSCKYLFKIPKQNQRPITPTSNKNRNQETQIKPFQMRSLRTVNRQVQTQKYLMGSLKTSPKKEKINSPVKNTGAFTDRTPEQQFAFNDQLNFDKRKTLFTDRPRSRIGKQQVSSSRKKETVGRSNEKISNLVSKNKETKSSYPARSAYMNSTQPVGKKNKQVTFQQPLQKNQQSKYIEQKHQKQMETEKKKGPSLTTSNSESDINRKIVRQLVNKIQLTEQINQIIQYHSNLPAELSIPSYCKMLIYNIQQRKQADQARTRLEEMKKYSDDQFYNARVEQLRSKYEKDRTQGIRY